MVLGTMIMVVVASRCHCEWVCVVVAGFFHLVLWLGLLGIVAGFAW